MISDIFNQSRIGKSIEKLIYSPPKQESPIVYCFMRPEKEQIPDHWSFIDFEPTNLPTGCVRAHSIGEITGKITFFLGFKTRPREYNRPEIRALQRAGFEIDFIPLPDPGKQIGYLQDYKNIVIDTVSGNFPRNGIENHVPHFLFGHSLGARAIIAASQDDETRRHINDKFAGCTLISPHLRSPFMSNPLLNIPLSLYFKKYKDLSYPNGPFDHFLNKKSNSAPVVGDPNAITYHQILYSNYETSDLIEGLKSERRHVSGEQWNVPTLMIGGKQDFISNKEIIKLAADVIGATYVESKAGHNSFMECKETRDKTRAFMYQQYATWPHASHVRRGAFVTKKSITYNQWEDPMPSQQ